jgi:two-component system, LuxR family, sensor kinase FixL
MPPRPQLRGKNRLTASRLIAFFGCILHIPEGPSFMFKRPNKNGKKRVVPPAARRRHPDKRVVTDAPTQPVPPSAPEHEAEFARVHRRYSTREFVAVVAHELSQPLTAIASYSEAGLQALQRDRIDAATLARDLEQIRRQAERAGQVIRDLRQSVARDQNRHEPVELNALVAALADLLAPGVRARGARIVLALGAAPLTTLGTDVEITCVLANLVQNAVAAIHGAGTADGAITIRTAAHADGQARITVEDNGPGLPLDFSAKLFKPLRVIKPDGLRGGLAISRAIVEAHGGRIWAEPAATGGATFHFTLPLQP